MLTSLKNNLVVLISALEMKNDSYVCEKLFLGTARPGRGKFISESIEMFHTSLGLRHGVQTHTFVVVCVLTTCYHAIKSFTKKNDACSSLKLDAHFSLFDCSFCTLTIEKVN